jgi:hypothetical protein
LRIALEIAKEQRKFWFHLTLREYLEFKSQFLINPIKWEIIMKHRESLRSLPKRQLPFTPDSYYIKKALEEFENRGGKITKLQTGNSYYNNMKLSADRHLKLNSETK